MGQIVIDARMRERLAKVREPVDLVDESGQKLGRYTPEPICPWDPSLTADGIDQIIRDSKGASLADIKKRHGMA